MEPKYEQLIVGEGVCLSEFVGSLHVHGCADLDGSVHLLEDSLHLIVGAPHLGIEIDHEAVFAPQHLIILACTKQILEDEGIVVVLDLPEPFAVLLELLNEVGVGGFEEESHLIARHRPVEYSDPVGDLLCFLLRLETIFLILLLDPSFHLPDLVLLLFVLAGFDGSVEVLQVVALGVGVGLVGL